jgi:hypothetical protein
MNDPGSSVSFPRRRESRKIKLDPRLRGDDTIEKREKNNII